MAETPHIDAEAQQPQLFVDIDAQALRFEAIRRLTLYVSNRSIEKDDVPVALLFWGRVLGSHAANSGRSTTDPEYAAVVEYFHGGEAARRLPDIIKQNFHIFVGSIPQLAESYEETKRNYEAGQKEGLAAAEPLQPLATEALEVKD